jgi:hypothetical protein
MNRRSAMILLNLLLAALILAPYSFAAEISHPGPSLARVPLAVALNTPAPAPAVATAQPGGAFALWLAARSGPDANPSYACNCLGTPCKGGYVCCFYTGPSGGSGCFCTTADLCYGP